MLSAMISERKVKSKGDFMTLSKKHILWDVALTATMFAGMVTYQGCKAASANISTNATAPNYTNAGLQAAHKYAMDTAASVKSGALVLSPTAKAAFNAFGAALDAADATYISFYKGYATQAQVTASVNAMTAKMTAAQTAIAKGN